MRAARSGGKALDEDWVRRLSASRREPAWLLASRLEGLKALESRLLPADAPPVELPDPAAEVSARPAPAGPVEELRRAGASFLELGAAVTERPELVRRHLASVVGPADGACGALNAAAWTEGIFVHLPKGSRLEVPLQAFLQLEGRRRGRFERVLIVAEEGAQLEFLEGCSAPLGAAALRAGVVELVLEAGARVRYHTLQHWPREVYNLAAKRARLGAEARLEWTDANLGSGVTVKHPAAVLAGPKASAELLVCGLAGEGQRLDAGGELVLAAPECSGRILQLCAARRGGVARCRTVVRALSGAAGGRAEVRGEALLLDPRSRVEFYPRVEAECEPLRLEQALSVSDPGQDRLHYMRSRGLGAAEAERLLLQGFFDPAARALPLEFSVEFTRLLDLELAPEASPG